MTDKTAAYPAHLDSSLDPHLSRGLWLVKWLALIPHLIVLAFLWLAFTVLSVVAFFSILFTTHYPRSLFDFNVGVLRWTWRVQYYGYGALGTDRYPPFTLADVPDYPAHFDVVYPARLSRGLVLVKWWLLAIPHYLIVAVFVGGGAWLSTGWWPGNSRPNDGWAFGGLVPLLVIVAGLVLLFTGRYPRPMYDFVLGMNRWAFRVAAYAALMTDEYPPFRLDMGGTDPAHPTPEPSPTAPLGAGAAPAGFDPTVAPAGPVPQPASGPRAAPTTSWTAGRVVAVVVGALFLLASTGFLTGGGALLWADRSQRDDAGYVWTPDATVSTGQYAVTTRAFELEGSGLDWVVDNVVGTVRVELTPTGSTRGLFIGVARTADADAYLKTVGRETLFGALAVQWNGTTRVPTSIQVAGGPPSSPPDQERIWVASSTGQGKQVLTWRPAAGQWTVVVMRADAGAQFSFDVRAAATVPALGLVATALLVLGIMLAAAGTLLIASAVARAHGNHPDTPGQRGGGGPVPPAGEPSGEPAAMSALPPPAKAPSR